MYDLYESNSNKRYNVFVCYHHANDQDYRDQFEQFFSNTHDIMLSQSIQIGDILENINTERIRQILKDKYLRDTTVTVVLIDQKIWQRKYVDGKIGLSIRHSGFTKIDNLSNNKSVKSWIHEAFLKRNRVIPDNVFPTFAKNISGNGCKDERKVIIKKEKST